MLIGFGVGIIGGGVFIRMGQDVFFKYIAKYVYSSTNPYYLASDVLWNALPYVLILVGVVCLIMGGLLGRSQKTVVYE